MIDSAVPAALNHLLNQAAWARQRLAPFVGRQMAVSMPPWRARLRIAEDGWFAAGSNEATPDVEIVLPGEAPLLALQGMEELLHAARIEGNAQFAGELAYVLKNLRWDYEEDLSRLFGDIAAHRLAGGIAAFAGWQKQAAGSLVQAIASYAAEGNHPLAKRADGLALADEVAGLRNAIDRAEQRIAALAMRVGGKS